MAGTQWEQAAYINQNTVAHNDTKWSTLQGKDTFSAATVSELSAPSVGVVTSVSAVRSMQESVAASKQRIHKIIRQYVNKGLEFHGQYKCANIP